MYVSEVMQGPQASPCKEVGEAGKHAENTKPFAMTVESKLIGNSSKIFHFIHFYVRKIGRIFSLLFFLILVS